MRSVNLPSKHPLCGSGSELWLTQLLKPLADEMVEFPFLVKSWNWPTKELKVEDFLSENRQRGVTHTYCLTSEIAYIGFQDLCGVSFYYKFH